MPVSTARVATDNPQRLITRLSKHWAHKLPVALGEGSSDIRFERGRCRLEDRGTELWVRLDAEEDETLRQLEQVVASHLQRMAAAPLPEFAWQRQD